MLPLSRAVLFHNENLKTAGCPAILCSLLFNKEGPAVSRLTPADAS